MLCCYSSISTSSGHVVFFYTFCIISSTGSNIRHFEQSSSFRMHNPFDILILGQSHINPVVCVVPCAGSKIIKAMSLKCVDCLRICNVVQRIQYKFELSPNVWTILVHLLVVQRNKPGMPAIPTAFFGTIKTCLILLSSCKLSRR
jgi:hypothetical protein